MQPKDYVNCENCGKSFKVIESRKGQRRFCSLTCRKEAESFTNTDWESVFSYCEKEGLLSTSSKFCIPYNILLRRVKQAGINYPVSDKKYGERLDGELAALSVVAEERFPHRPWTTKEIAYVVDATPQSLHHLINKALNNMRKGLKKACPDLFDNKKI